MILFLCCSSSMLVSIPNDSRSSTQATGTPGSVNARNRLGPKLTVVTTFSLLGSISLVALPSQPSVPSLSGSQVCQISIERKWDRGAFAYPTPWMMAILPCSYIFLIGPISGWNPILSLIFNIRSSATPTAGRLS